MNYVVAVVVLIVLAVAAKICKTMGYYDTAKMLEIAFAIIALIIGVLAIKEVYVQIIGCMGVSIWG